MMDEETQGPTPESKALRSSSVETLKRSLQYYLEYEPEFVAMFFPRMAERGYVVRSDAGEMTHRQADALCPLLLDSVRYFERQDAKERSKQVRSSDPVQGPTAGLSEFGRKAQLWSDALRDLCEVFGLQAPA
jgi:hypothetical protein